MSLTSQLDQKNSPVSMFFRQYESGEGIKECLAALQSSKRVIPPPYEPSSRSVWGFIGTTTDYLIRYVANSNQLDLNKTIAHEAVFYANDGPALLPLLPLKQRETVNALWNIGGMYLNGRRPDESVVYSATALSMLDNVFRSGGRLPRSFDEPLAPAEREMIGTVSAGYDENEKEAMVRFYGYFCNTLGGAPYTQDILTTLDTFSSAIINPNDEMTDAKISTFNSALANSHTVGGADFDCVITKGGARILTDIKTTIKPLPANALRQLIGYALLHEPQMDGFDFDHMGIYFSRSGSFRYLPTKEVFQRCFPSLKTLEAAKATFFDEIQP